MGFGAEPVFITVRGIPWIDSLAPAEARAGDSIVILGRGFDPSPQKNEVRFTSSAGLMGLGQISEASANRIRVAVPSSASSGPVRVAASGRN